MQLRKTPLGLVAAVVVAAALAVPAPAAAVTCPSPVPVIQENNCSGPGTTAWRTTSYTTSLAAYADTPSVDLGQSVPLKIGRNGAGTVNIAVFRMGYYGGTGGRLVHSANNVSVTNNIACTTPDTTFGKSDCSNWPVTYTIPGSALPASGVYMVKLTDGTTGGQTQAIFVVRDDSRAAPVLYKLPDATYQAYNGWGGKSLYDFTSTGFTTVAGSVRAAKVSFDRPYANLDWMDNWFMKSDYPLVYWLERQGYDVAYTDNTSVHTTPSQLLNHQVLVISGHDEYWSREELLGYLNARNAGVNIASFSSNTSYWKVRYEDSGATMVGFKTVQGSGSTGSGSAGANDWGPDKQLGTADDALGLDGRAGTADDHPENSTTTFRDNGAAPGDPNAPSGGRVGPNMPENQLLGSMYVGDNDPKSYALNVPPANGNGEFAGDRIWRNTGITAGAGRVFSGSKFVGWEWDAIPAQGQYQAFQPAGVKRLTGTNVNDGSNWIQDEGRVYATTPPPGQSGDVAAVKYRAASGALVFSAGTNQWSWGLGPHWRDQQIGSQTYQGAPFDSTDSRIGQATYNILSDMGAQPATPTGVVVDSGNQPPEASFTVTPNPAQAGQQVTFDASASLDPDGSLTRYQWDLDGNGTFETDTGTTPTASRSYPSDGTLTISLRVTDNAGLTGDATRSLNIGAGLVAAYSFDEASGATVGDASGRGNTGSITGATRTTAGKYGGAISFDGNADMVTVPDSNSLDLTGGMTLEAWVNPTSPGGWQTALIKETSGDLVYGLYGASSYPGAGAAAPSSWIGPDDLGAPAALPAGQWSHLAVTYDHSTWRLFVNGNEVVSRAYTGDIPTSTGALRIGGNSIWAEWFNGKIDEVRVYNRALSALELAHDRDTAIAGGPPPPDTTPPTVSLTAPANGATVAGSAVAVSANASDNVGVTNVQFRLDGADLGSPDTTAPYSVNWNTTGATEGDHTLTAIARDAAGNTTTATTITVTVDNVPAPDTTPPTVSITAPANGATVAGSAVAVSANASDNVGVTNVQFRLDGADLGSPDTTAPYSVNWNTTAAAEGDHTLTAIARDAAGNTTTATTITVTVDNVPAPDTTPPTVSLTAPANGATVAGSAVAVSANASDNVGVTNVQFRLDGADLASPDTTAPYTVNWNTTGAANGDHTLTAIARDAAGNTTTATSVTVTVDNDTTPPTVSLTAPADGATVTGSSVAVNANASDNRGVSGVQFKLDGANLGIEDTTSPYGVTWNSTGVANGNHTLSAVARDAAGNTTTATPVTVNAQNTGPSPDLMAAYAFDEPSGTSVTDASGHNNTGTIVGGATRTTAGKFGSAITFDGVNDLVSVPDSNSLDLTSGMTLEAWVFPTNVNGWRCVILKETTGDLVYGLYGGSQVGGTTRPSAWLGATGLNGTAELPVNQWSHLATTYDRTTWRLYVNGTQVASRALTPAIATSTGALRIGGNNIWPEWFAGRLDDIRIYNRALTPAEIVADRDRGVGG